MTEKVLAIDRKHLDNRWLSNKISIHLNPKKLEYLTKHIEWIDRKIAELDETKKQIIPYLIVESEKDNKIGIYKRKGSEARIHGLYSIGIGGHVNPEDFKPGDTFYNNILSAAQRELSEEFLDFKEYKSIEFLGLINEEATKVGRTHIGLVFKVRTDIKWKPADELFHFRWIPKKDIISYSNMELWSKMTLDLDSNIFHFFTDFRLTSDQENTLAKLEEFLHNDDHIFILKGYAGTGKTTLLKGIASYLDQKMRLGGLMAPTGRAAKVIKDVTGFNGSTIHRAIYDFENLKTFKAKDKNGNESFKFFFALRAEDYIKNSVFIFDEASMISNVYAEGEFFRFGSGYLLDDILDQFNPKNENRLKLIFVGDPAQLPPVGTSKSVALIADYFAGLGFNVSESEMTDVVRQDSNSGILYNAAYYRKLIFSEKVAENNLKTDFNDIEEIPYVELSRIFTGLAPVPDISKNIIISHSNERAFNNNKMIREIYFPGSPAIQEGDILQVIRNSYRTGLLNGEFVNVTRVNPEIVTRSAKIWINQKQVLIKFQFRSLTVHTDDGRSINTLILDSLLNSKNRDLTSNEMKALYVNFIMRYEKIFGYANRNSLHFKNSFKDDPYFNALQVKYGYAITGHKAQGGEWENAFVDFSGRTGLSKDELRWCYTSITRASKKLFVLKAPKESRFNLRNRNFQIGKVKSVPKLTPELKAPENTPFHGPETLYAKRAKYNEISSKIYTSGFEILNVVSKDYQEIYTFKKGHQIYKVTLSHNAKGVFSYIACNKKNETGNELVNILKTTPEHYEFNYTPKEGFPEELFGWVENAVKQTGLKIVYVDESKLVNYHIIYSFIGKESESYIQFYFNKNERINSMVAKSTIGENDTELRKLINILSSS